MEVETVSQAIHVTRQLLGSMRLPVTDTENIDKARTAIENLNIVYDILAKAEQEARMKKEEQPDDHGGEPD